MNFTLLTSTFSFELTRIETAIQNNVHAHLPLMPPLVSHLLSQHDPIRSLLAISLAKTQDEFTDPMVNTCSAIEYLHAASILHRRIKTTEEFRRYRKQFTSIWGNEASVLLGDYLLSSAFQTLTRLQNLEILQIVAEATMCIAEGQMLEISHSWDSMSRKHYEQMIEKKFASLFAVSAQSVGIWLELSQEQKKCLAEIGSQLGMVFHYQADLQKIKEPKEIKSILEHEQPILPFCFLYETTKQPLATDGQIEQIEEQLTKYEIQKVTTNYIQQMVERIEHKLLQLPQSLQQPIQSLLKEIMSEEKE